MCEDLQLALKGIVFGVHVPPEGRSFQEMKDMCLWAEKLGFDLFTVTDHFMNMMKPDGPDRHPLECWSTLAGLAAVTSRIRLGPLVMLLLQATNRSGKNGHNNRHNLKRKIDLWHRSGLAPERVRGLPWTIPPGERTHDRTRRSDTDLPQHVYE